MEDLVLELERDGPFRAVDLEHVECLVFAVGRDGEVLILEAAELGQPARQRPVALEHVGGLRERELG
jgi:hypothetical protein